MDLSIIIVSWKVRDLLGKCLQSIYANRDNIDLEVFVVDNNSQDGTIEMVSRDFPQVTLIASNVNLGFAKANNLALEQARGRYLLLLNPDTEILPRTLKNSLSFMESHPDCGLMGPRLTFADGSPQPSVRRFPSPWPILLLLLKISKIFPHLKAIDRYLAKDFDYAKIQSAEQIMGAYMLIRRQALKKIGLLDERFFVWFEEVDFCRRAWQAGFKVYYNPAAAIIHHGGKSFSQQQLIANQWRFFTSAWKYFIKHGLSRPNVQDS